MNEKIKELMGKTLDSKFSHTWTALNYADLEKFSEKLVELTVEECSQVCLARAARYKAINHLIADEAIFCSIRIKQHFGDDEWPRIMNE